MRIQHNIMAMNAYRNYNNNTSALSKNLEKLSSGYKINRAGDDAAGLAISEKMRAQITGLNAAQKNVKDGISLVKTGEGAMQEIQDMLNRMDYLATQSANGTYDNEVDRANLQKEVDALKSEINRIADSANFNGIKLLDGSLAGGSTGGKVPEINSNLALAAQNATKGKYETAALTDIATLNAGDEVKVSINLEDANGKTQTVTMKFTVGAASDGTAKKGLIAEDGTVYDLAAAGKGDKAALGAAITGELAKNSTVADNFDISVASDKLTLEAKETGSSVPKATGFEISHNNSGKFVSVSNGMSEATKAMDKYYTTDLATAAAWDGKKDSLQDSIIDIGGKKFAFVDKGKLTADALAQLKAAGVDHYVETAAAGAIDETDVKAMVEKMRLEGLNVEQGAVTGGVWGKDEAVTTIAIMADSLAGGGLTLQIGDTADSYNQMKVSIGDMHTRAMGIAGVDISNQDGAAAAIQTIKDAINYVSGVRGDLGAVQNRLEHTQNNLSVMAENIQDAESTIRDTDVAEEMMSYVKNNILVQSAQAMLAQANQVPQGVLQLLG